MARPGVRRPAMAPPAAQAAPMREAERLLKAGDAMASARCLNEAIKQRPKDVALYVALSRVLIRHVENTKAAAQVADRALKLAPREPAVLQEAMDAYIRVGRHVDAARCADRMVRTANPTPEQLSIASMAYRDNERLEDAHACLERALKKDPGHLQSRILIGESYRTLGRFEEAVEVARKVLALDPFNLEVTTTYIESMKLPEGDPVVAGLAQEVIPTLRARGESETLSRFIELLAKARNDAGHYGEAFQLYQEAKRVFPNPHDSDAVHRITETLRTRMVPALFEAPGGNEDQRPVLIVGMPRGGSTLLEQILANHPQVATVRESPVLHALLKSVGIEAGDADGLVALASDSQSRQAELAEAYLANTAALHPGALRVVDKQLFNFQRLGVFARAFPNARVIHTLRDPMDHCVACYMRALKRFHSYTWDLTALGRYYREYRTLMDHWKAVLPIPILDVVYEDVVADTEAQARRAIEFLGLDWDPACLDFTRSGSHVMTQSAWQVRQPIYQSSVKRWKRYEAFLDPLKAELAPFYPEGFDA